MTVYYGPNDASTAWHESHHIASAILDGLMPLSVAVDAHNGLGAYGEDGTKHVAGRVKFAPETFDTPEGCAAYVVSLLMGAKCDGGEPQATVDRWPVRPSEWKARNESDAKQIKFVTEELEMDQIGWGRLCFKAAERTKDKRFRRLVTAIARELEAACVLDKADLERIAGEVWDG